MAEPKFIDLKVNCAVDMVNAMSVKKDVSKDVKASVEIIKPNRDGIVTENAGEVLGRKLVKTYSKNGKYIIQDGTGAKYIEAIDPEECHRTYTESDEDIPEEELAPPPAPDYIEAEYTEVEVNEDGTNVLQGE